MEEVYLLLLFAGLRRVVLLLREVLLLEAFLPAARFLLRAAFFLASAFNFAFLFLVRAAFFAAALRAALDLPMPEINSNMPYNVQVTTFCVMT